MLKSTLGHTPHLCMSTHQSKEMVDSKEEEEEEEKEEEKEEEEEEQEEQEEQEEELNRWMKRGG